MIWILVITMIVTDPKAASQSPTGAVVAHPNERACEKAKAEFTTAIKADPKPGLLFVVGCSPVKLPMNA